MIPNNKGEKKTPGNTPVIAHDGTDSGAQERRLKARETHLENVKAMKAKGRESVYNNPE